MSLLLIILGAALLYIGGDLLVKNSVRLAARLGLSSLVIGLTVVAFGTSAPELAATLASVLEGAPGLAIGNVIGSNIANIGLILGFTAVLYPLYNSRFFLRRELPVAIGVSLLLIPLFWDGVMSRLEGLFLLGLLAAYLWYVIKSDPEQITAETEDDAESDDEKPLWRSLFFVLLGVALLVIGARSLVTGAVAIARSLGVSEAVIGLSMVAFGTSLPELASSVVAALRKETDIILGNIVGSNLFNILAVLGTTVVISPISQPFSGIGTDIIIMIAFTLAVWPLMFWNRRISRRDGIILSAAYVGYIAYLFI